jgi:hypothetical protein
MKTNRGKSGNISEQRDRKNNDRMRGGRGRGMGEGVRKILETGAASYLLNARTIAK